MIDQLKEFASSPLFIGLAILAAVLFAATLFLVPWLLVRLPEDYFADHDPKADRWREHHPVIRWTVLIAKNVVGAALIIAGVFMLGFWGPGLLTIVLGLTLVSIPGKRRFARWILNRGPLLTGVNKLRARYNQPPLKL